MKHYSRQLGAILVLVALPSLAFAKLSTAGGGSAQFSATGPAGLKIDGKTNDVKVDENGDNVVVAVTLTKLDTGIDLRNKHMREKYLQVDKFPTAELTVPRSQLKFPSDGAETAGSAQGTMKLHGQSHPITFTYKARREGDTFSVSGSTSLKMTEYGIEQPGYLGVTVKPEVGVTVSFKAKDTLDSMVYMRHRARSTLVVSTGSDSAFAVGTPGFGVPMDD